MPAINAKPQSMQLKLSRLTNCADAIRRQLDVARAKHVASTTVRSCLADCRRELIQAELDCEALRRQIVEVRTEIEAAK